MYSRPVLALFVVAWAIVGTLRPSLAAVDASVPGELIVGFHEAVGPAAREAVHDGIGARVLLRAAHRPLALVRFEDDEAGRLAQAAYRARPEVAFAHPNYHGRAGFTPDDTQWSAHWHHRNVGQTGGVAGADLESESGWDIHRGSASVTVAVLDTGLDLGHPDFAGRVVAGWDFVAGDPDPSDDHGHGTRVTGILAANADNGFAVAGVDHFCRVMPVKILGSGGLGTTFDLISGIDFARTNGADVINMSLIDFPLTAGLTAALQTAKDAGIVLVACAGNGGLGDADVSGPGASSHTISVGATNEDDERTGFSASGQALEFVAPGRNVETVVFGSTADVSVVFTGCSAATPIVSGIASILKSVDPSLTTDDVRALLATGAEDQVGFSTEDTAGWDEYHGWGRVNIRRTLEAVAGPVDAPEVIAAARALNVEVSPNPARGSTTVRFHLPLAGWVEASVYDVAGRPVRRLARGAYSVGVHVLAWDALGDRGVPAPPAVYFLRVAARDQVRVRKITLVR